MQSRAVVRRKVPLAIHGIAFLYIIQTAIIIYVFIYTREKVSLPLIRVDVITLLLLLIPVMALWSIYRPHRYTRCFLLYGIVFIWIIGIGISRLLHVVWLEDASTLREMIGTFDVITGGALTLAFFVMFTLWMLIAYLPLLFIPSANAYVFGTKR